MALDITLEANKIVNEATGQRGFDAGEHYCSMQSDGYYWFLYPTFEEIAAKAGQMIDLYGDATFEGKSAEVLKEFLQKKLTSLTDKPDQWQQLIGTTNSGRQIMSTVEKGVLRQFLEQFIAIIDYAAQRGQRVICVGG